MQNTEWRCASATEKKNPQTQPLPDWRQRQSETCTGNSQTGLPIPMTQSVRNVLSNSNSKLVRNKFDFHMQWYRPESQSAPVSLGFRYFPLPTRVLQDSSVKTAATASIESVYNAVLQIWFDNERKTRMIENFYELRCVCRLPSTVKTMKFWRQHPSGKRAGWIILRKITARRVVKVGTDGRSERFGHGGLEHSGCVATC
jgi:hypothetical protein